MPIGFAPTCIQCLAHPDGEAATSRAASQLNIPMILSTFSTVSMEDVISASKGGQNPYGFQPIFPPNRSITLDMMKRAESKSIFPYDKTHFSNQYTLSLNRMWLQGYFYHRRCSSYCKSYDKKKKRFKAPLSSFLPQSQFRQIRW